MYQTGIQRRFNARHALVGDFGDERTPHTHSYLVEWIRGRRELDENGFATDIAAMEAVLEEELAAIDDRLLNDMPFFAGIQTSLENVCRFLHYRLENNLVRRTGEREQSDRHNTVVRIWENDSAWASYEASPASIPHSETGSPDGGA